MDEKTLTIMIGGDMDKDERQLKENPIDALNDIPRNILYIKSYEQLNKLLSAAKLDLLRYLIKISRAHEEKSVSEIAEILKRKQEAISRDLHYLKGLNLIDLKKVNRTTVAFTDFDSININLAKNEV